MRKPIPTIKRLDMPTFAELYDACVDDPEKTRLLCHELGRLLGRCGLRTRVREFLRVLDTCAGTGSLDIDLLGTGAYDLTSADGDAEMLGMFRNKLVARGFAKHQPILACWQDYPEVFRDRRFDALLCLGNSLMYSGGYWNGDGEIDPERSKANLLDVLRHFYLVLKTGGALIADKPPDDEREIEELVARLEIERADPQMGVEKYDVCFSVKFDASRTRREASLLLRDRVTGQERGTPNVTYHLKDGEFIELLELAGFANIERTAFVGHRFPVWVARK